VRIEDSNGGGYERRRSSVDAEGWVVVAGSTLWASASALTFRASSNDSFDWIGGAAKPCQSAVIYGMARKCAFSTLFGLQLSIIFPVEKGRLGISDIRLSQPLTSASLHLIQHFPIFPRILSIIARLATLRQWTALNSRLVPTRLSTDAPIYTNSMRCTPVAIQCFQQGVNQTGDLRYSSYPRAHIKLLS